MSTGTFTFMYPEWLILLPILLILTLALQRRTKFAKIPVDPSRLVMTSNQSTDHLFHPLIHLLPTKHLSRKSPIFRSIMVTIILSSFVIALAEPVRIGKRLPDPQQERDIVFIIDTSVSMVLRDYILDGQRIDRMSLLKELLDRFIQKLQGERISLIVLGDEVYTLVPLTRDQVLLRRMLSRIEPGMAGRFSAIGEGVALAVKQASNTKYRHRLLILLTDASSPTGKISPMTAAQMAKEHHLPLYTITIGAQSYAAEEIRSAGLIYHPANPALLQSMSERTGAQSYQASNSQTLEQAIQDIEKRETNKQEIIPRYYHEALFIWPLLLGLILCVKMQIFYILGFGK